MRRLIPNTFAMTTLLILVGCSFTSIEPNPEHCVNNGGNDYCLTRGYMFCAMGTLGCPGHDTPQGDGCVQDPPTAACYSPCGGGPLISPGGDHSCLDTTSDGEGDAEGGVSSQSDAETSESSGWALDGSSEGMSETTSGDDSSTGTSTGLDPAEPSDHPPCNDNGECTEPYICYDILLPDYSLCTETCVDHCPFIADGIPMSCSWIPLAFGRPPQCVVDCRDDDDCPTGMSCQSVDIPVVEGWWEEAFDVNRCLWPHRD